MMTPTILQQLERCVHRSPRKALIISARPLADLSSATAAYPQARIARATALNN